MTNEELILKKLDELAAEVKEVRTEIKDVRADNSEMKVNQVKLEGKLDTLEAKFDGHVADMRERKTDTNKRWKIAGIIIASGCLAIVSLFLSLFK
ncbi:hypothetical protein C6495_18105 [Candidatus Poribacteria bacterium]|nr:MAG: hypothetical protein C6495_18105 [Candidatus Poribacteria bacterium]